MTIEGGSHHSLLLTVEETDLGFEAGLTIPEGFKVSQWIESFGLETVEIEDPLIVAGVLKRGEFQLDPLFGRAVYPDLQPALASQETIAEQIRADRALFTQAGMDFLNTGQYAFLWQQVLAVAQEMGEALAVQEPTPHFLGHIDFRHIDARQVFPEGVVTRGGFITLSHAVIFDSFFSVEGEEEHAQTQVRHAMFLVHELFEATCDSRLGGGLKIPFTVDEIKALAESKDYTAQIFPQKLEALIESGQRIPVVQRGMERFDHMSNIHRGGMIREGTIQNMTSALLYGLGLDRESVTAMIQKVYFVPHFALIMLDKHFNVPLEHFWRAHFNVDHAASLVTLIDQQMGRYGHLLLERLLDHDGPINTVEDSLCLEWLIRKAEAIEQPLPIPRLLVADLTPEEMDEIASGQNVVFIDKVN